MAAVKVNAKESVPVQVRYGVDVPQPMGMRPDIDAIALGKADFVHLQNIRRIGTSVVMRPGSTGFVQLLGDPTGLGDLPVGNIGALMMVSDGCPGEDPTAGFSLLSYDEEQINSATNSRFFPIIYRTTATTFTIARFVRDVSVDGLIPAVDAMFFAVENVLYRLAEVPFPYGTLPLSNTNGVQEIPVWTLPSGFTSIGEMMQFGSSLYISAAAAAGTSAIFAYDGLTFTRVLDSVDPITGFAVFRNLLIAGHDGATTNLIRVWNGTAWSTVAPGAGTVKIEGNRCASYHDTLYIPADDNIFSYDGITTLTRIAPGTTGVDVGSVIFGLESCFDRLYATWRTVAPKARLLQYDGTTWTPTHKDFIAQFPDCAAVRAIRFFHGALMVAGIDVVSPGPGARLYRSPRRTTSGTWTELLPNITDNTSDIRDIVRSRS